MVESELILNEVFLCDQKMIKKKAEAGEKSFHFSG